ncbi:hypothetical protein [Vibrio parahaemolyticus]|nr:hypothetical protein [Vibrio parahaemolyticus]
METKGLHFTQTTTQTGSGGGGSQGSQILGGAMAGRTLRGALLCL